MKNRVLPEHRFPPGDLERQIDAFAGDRTNARHRESPGPLTPADVCVGRVQIT